MKLSVELTLYPLQEHYLDIIEAVIEKLHRFSEVSVSTFPTATIIVGEYDVVMDVMRHTIRWSYEEYGKCVFVAKFLPGHEACTR